MAEKKPTPRATKIVFGGVLGGLAAVTIGQRAWAWTLESQTNTIIVAVIGLVVGVIAALVVTAPKKKA
jgi:hypothetical protein